MSCTPNHLLIELGVSRRELGHHVMEGRDNMEQPSLREQHLQADADSVRADYGRVRNALDTAVRLKLLAQTEGDRLRAVNAKLLSALESIQREATGVDERTEGWKNDLIAAALGSLERIRDQAREAIEEARK